MARPLYLSQYPRIGTQLSEFQVIAAFWAGSGGYRKTQFNSLRYIFQVHGSKLQLPIQPNGAGGRSDAEGMVPRSHPIVGTRQVELLAKGSPGST
jgi:hypothetical protein